VRALANQGQRLDVVVVSVTVRGSVRRELLGRILIVNTRHAMLVLREYGDKSIHEYTQVA
jgi:hypothetical protein